MRYWERALEESVHWRDLVSDFTIELSRWRETVNNIEETVGELLDDDDRSKLVEFGRQWVSKFVEGMGQVKSPSKVFREAAAQAATQMAADLPKWHEQVDAAVKQRAEEEVLMNQYINGGSATRLDSSDVALIDKFVRASGGWQALENDMSRRICLTALIACLDARHEEIVEADYGEEDYSTEDIRGGWYAGQNAERINIDEVHEPYQVNHPPMQAIFSGGDGSQSRVYATAGKGWRVLEQDVIVPPGEAREVKLQLFNLDLWEGVLRYLNDQQ